jgi:hypothetical protein
VCGIEEITKDRVDETVNLLCGTTRGNKWKPKLQIQRMGLMV